MSAARWRSSRVCAGLHSAPVRRSVDKEIGATREVVVIRFIPWAKREVVRAVDQQTPLHGLGDKRSAFAGKLDTDHQPFRADFANEVELRSEFAESLPQLFAARTDVLEKLFLFHDAQKFERHGAS